MDILTNTPLQKDTLFLNFSKDKIIFNLQCLLKYTGSSFINFPIELIYYLILLYSRNVIIKIMLFHYDDENEPKLTYKYILKTRINMNIIDLKLIITGLMSIPSRMYIMVT